MNKRTVVGTRQIFGDKYTIITPKTQPILPINGFRVVL